MPTNILNQPVQWDLPILKGGDQKYYQFIRDADKLNFQLLADVGTNLIVDNLAWTFAGDQTAEELTWTGNQNANQDILTLGIPYKVTLNITELSTAGNTFVLIGTGTIIQITSSGYHEIYGTCATDTLFQISSNIGTVIDNNITVQEIDDEPAEIAAVDEDGNIVEVLWTNTDLVDQNLIYQNKDLPADIDCFKLTFIEEGSDVLIGGDFSTPSDWTITGDGEISGGAFKGTNIAGDTTVTQELNTGDYSLFLPSSTIEPPTDAEAYFEILDGDGVSVYAEQYSSSAHVFPWVYLDSHTTYTVRIRVRPLAPTNEFVISDVALTNYASTIFSNLFQKITAIKNTILIQANDIEDVYGFKFDNDFIFNLRIIASLHLSEDETESEIIKYSNGNKQVRFSDSEEELTFSTDFVPLYIHRAIRKMRLMEVFQLDSIRHVIADENYSTDWNKDFNLAPAEFNVTLYNQDYTNINT